MKIVIVDYGLGNLASIKKMLNSVGQKDVVISSEKDEISGADKIILPGVGAFDKGMSNLNDYNLIEVLNFKALEQKTPILGICLGMQLMTKSSEEGILPGLGWFDAVTVKFNFENDKNNKVPHMGWNYVEEVNPLPFLLPNPNMNRFYFVHSYHVKCRNRNDVICDTNHGYHFNSIISKNNLLGVQFHPEKSLKYGANILRNFVKN